MRKIIFILTVVLLGLPWLAHAQTTAGDLTSVDPAALGTLIKTISVWIRVFAYTLSVGLIIYAGILYFQSATNPAASGTAKNVIKAVLVGLAIVILSEVLVRTTLGFVTKKDNQQGIDKVLHPATTPTPPTP